MSVNENGSVYEQNEKQGSIVAKQLTSPTNTQPVETPQQDDRPSIASSDSYVHIVSAIDFHSDGCTSIHTAYLSARASHMRPSFECPLPPKSVRVIFYYTQDVFPRFESEVALTDGDDNDKRSILKCTDCGSPSGSKSGQSLTSLHDSPKPSSTSHISPCTSVRDRRVLETSPNADPADSDSFVYVRRKGRRRANSISTRTRSRSRSQTLSRSTNSSRSSYSSRSDDDDDERKTWKRYRGGFSIDSMDVFRMWERETDDRNIRIGINLMFDADDEVEVEDEKIWAKTIRSERHTMTLNGDMTTFFTIPHLLRVSRQADKDTLEVEARLFSTYVAEMRNNADMADSPLSDHLWNTLRSRKSAMALFDGDTNMGARLLAFDVLSATIMTWLNFLNRVRRKGAWQPRSFGDLDAVDQHRPMLGDREHIADFGRSTRDLLQGVDVCIKAVELAQKFNDDQRAKFDYLLLTRRSQHEVLQSTMKDIEDYIDGMVARAEQLTNERQDASLKRLTLVASIFLPLTMACSILSMSNRVNALGALWWDWLGIVCIIGLLVLIGYRLTSVWHNFWRKPRLQWAVQNFRREWERAKVDVIKEEAKKKERHSQTSRRRKRKGPTTQRYLIPAFNRIMFHMSKYLFVIGAVASFLVGMFLKVSTGAEALGYSAVGTIIVVLGSIIIWRLFRLSISKMANRPDHRNDRDIAGKQESEQQASSESKEQNEDPERERESKAEKRSNPFYVIGWVLRRLPLEVIFKIFLYPTIWFWKVWYWIFTIFFGHLMLKVVWQVLVNAIIDRIPIDLTILFNRVLTMGSRRKEKSDSRSDIESSGGRGRSRSRKRSVSQSRSRSRRQEQLRSELQRFGLGGVLRSRISGSRSRSRSRSQSEDHGNEGSRWVRRKSKKDTEEGISKSIVGVKKAKTFGHPTTRRADTRRFDAPASRLKRSATAPGLNEISTGKEKPKPK